ncbi:MAG: type I DNA topoisomerase [Planctomycetota bacterium]|nr:type I DNA topoisomerase [Planctomycetota bacterium]
MAKKKSTAKKSAKSGKSLVIVESPAKARTISKYLGKDFTVEASVGHVRDLPQGKKNLPEKYKDEEWADLGVNVNDDFDPVYVVLPGKSKQITALRKKLKDARELFLATDEDREGEAISWHLVELLKPKVPCHRLVFHEITKEAILDALANPRDLDQQLVRAQETRRILDRLYGYGVSPLLWRKVRTKLSAGRVQSVAVRLIVQRERERMAFVRATYWDLLSTFATQKGESFEATLITVNGQRIPTGKDFDSKTGKLTADRALLDEQQAQQLLERIRNGQFKVASLEEKPFTQKPYAPFTTSTLQQEGNRKLGFTTRHTMSVAQRLYENGHITYMRTDSTNLAKVAVDAARDLVSSEYGNDYLHSEPRIYQSKVKNAQEAHEAIRPAGHPFELPAVIKKELQQDEFRLFELIWKRTIASQMANARGRRISIIIEGEGCTFQVGGKVIDFPGFLRAYVEGSDDPHAELADKEKILPAVAVDEPLVCDNLEAKSHTTAPPARFSEASLTAALEDKGIGRPSTYAAIIDTILNRGYAFKRSNALVPTWVAFSVVNLLETHLPTLIDYEFTAQLEDDLDSISRGEADHNEYLHRFYFGNGTPGLKKQLEHKLEEIDAKKIGTISIGAPDDGPPIVVRVGRYAPFLEQGEQRATLPDEMPPDELTVEKAVELLAQSAKAEEPLGVCPDTHKPVYLKVGRFGPYVQRGSLDDEDKPKNASLLKGMQPDDIDLQTALKLLSLPRDLGQDPKTDTAVVVYNGRFGPYVKSGDETRSLPTEMSPLDITLPQALELLAQPKKSRGGFGAKKEPLKVFDESPVTKQKIQLLDGRYGPYVTDGDTNASLPKDSNVEELTFQQALDLLADRATKGPVKKKKKATKKKATAKKKGTTKKKSATKKTPAKKKSARKKKS